MGIRCENVCCKLITLINLRSSFIHGLAMQILLIIRISSWSTYHFWISQTPDIRKSILAGKSVKYLLLDGVLDYIRDKELY